MEDKKAINPALVFFDKKRNAVFN